jgi:O-antigen/teichoic acid export membrane protein
LIESLRQWLRGDFARHVTVLASGTALGQLLVIAVTPLLTRLYTPQDMGLAGMFASFLAFAGVAVTLRFDLAIATTRDRDEALRLLTLSLLACVPVSLVLGGLLYAMIRADVFAYGLLPAWTALLGFVALVATGAFVALRFWHVSRHGFAGVGRALVAQGAVRAITSVLLGLPRAGWAGLAFGEVLGRLAGIGRLWREAGPELRLARAEGRLAGLGDTWRRARHFPRVVLPSSLIDSLAAALPVPMIAWLFGAAEAGQFALVWRVAALPGSLIVASFGDVFHAHSTAARAGGPAQVRGLLRGTTRMLAVLAVAVYVPACLIAPWIFPWLFGEPWRPAGQMMLLLAPLWMASLVVSPVSRLPMVLGRPQVKLVFDVCFLVLPLGALWVFAPHGLMTAILAYGIAAAVAYAVFGLLLYDTAGRRAVDAHPDRSGPEKE